MKDFFDQVDGERKRKVSTKEPSDTAISPDETKAREQTLAEYRGGCELWESIEIVVSLSLNMRSSGELGRILSQMRAGFLDDAAWCSLQGRVLGVFRDDAGTLRSLPAGALDSRLEQPPFSTHRVHYILHRHVLRVSQSYINAVRESSTAPRRLYVFSAIDVVKDGQEARFTEKDKMEARKIANLRRVQFLSSHLALYESMHVLLFGKACVRLGLMNGCECRVERIILADDEPEFEEMTAGVPTCLEYLPAGLVRQWSRHMHVLIFCSGEGCEDYSFFIGEDGGEDYSFLVCEDNTFFCCCCCESASIHRRFDETIGIW